MTDNALAVRQGESRDLTVAPTPDQKLEAGRKAAISLKRMIDDTNSKIKIGSTEHIKAEAWQTVGSFFNVTAKTTVEPCEIEGIKGAKATAVLIDDVTGEVVGGGEAYCMRDERNWAGKPWMQLASMAQTRSASRALGNKYKWITVLAGYSPTPADELHDDEPRAARPAPRPVPTATGQMPEEAMPFETVALVAGIRDMLAKLNGGDEELMHNHLKTLTTWTDKETKEEKFLKMSDLAGVAKHKPQWIKGVHKKVTEEYQKAFDAEGNPK